MLDKKNIFALDAMFFSVIRSNGNARMKRLEVKLYFQIGIRLAKIPLM